jgi:hypothetical protein
MGLLAEVLSKGRGAVGLEHQQRHCRSRQRRAHRQQHPGALFIQVLGIDDRQRKVGVFSIACRTSFSSDATTTRHASSPSQACNFPRQTSFLATSSTPPRAPSPRAGFGGASLNSSGGVRPDATPISRQKSVPITRSASCTVVWPRCTRSSALSDRKRMPSWRASSRTWLSGAPWSSRRQLVTVSPLLAWPLSRPIRNEALPPARLPRSFQVRSIGWPFQVLTLRMTWMRTPAFTSARSLPSVPKTDSVAWHDHVPLGPDTPLPSELVTGAGAGGVTWPSAARTTRGNASWLLPSQSLSPASNGNVSRSSARRPISAGPARSAIRP